jgi:beta-carotene hydroxylase
MAIVNVAPDAFVPSEKAKPQKWLLCRNRSEELNRLCVPDGRKHLLFASPYIAVYVAALVGVFMNDLVWVNMLLSLVIANQLYLLFILHHDCMHGSAFKRDIWNVWMGRLYTTAFTMTFTVNRETHYRHHSYISDPDRDPDEYYFAAGMKDIWLRLWRYYEWYTRIALTKYGRRVRNTVLVEQVFNLALWGAIHAVLIQQGMGEKLLYIFWLPISFVVLVINPITRGYEHAPLTLYPAGDERKRDMTLNTITIANPLLGWLWGNITYHVEHHAYPNCPFYNLQRVYRIFQQEKLQYLTAPYPLYRIWKGRELTEGMTCNAEAVVEPAARQSAALG